MTVKLLLTCNMNIRKTRSGKLMLKSWEKIICKNFNSGLLYAESRVFDFCFLGFFWVFTVTTTHMCI